MTFEGILHPWRVRERKRYQERQALENVARGTVLYYFQSWGQGIQGRVKALNEAVAAAGIKATFVQDDTRSGWLGEPEEAERAGRFRDELDTCWPTGSFESEMSAVSYVIRKYRGGKE